MKCDMVVFGTGLDCTHPAKHKIKYIRGCWLYVCGYHARGIPKDKLVKLEKESK